MQLAYIHISFTMSDIVDISPDAVLAELLTHTATMRNRRVEMHNILHAHRNGAPLQIGRWSDYFDFVEHCSLRGPSVSSVVLAGVGLGFAPIETRRAIRRAVEACIGESVLTLAMYNSLRVHRAWNNSFFHRVMNVAWAEGVVREAQAYATWVAEMPPEENA